MADLKNKTELAEAARVVARSFNLVQRGALTFIPVDWETYSPAPPPSPDSRIWIPFSRDDKQRLATQTQKVLFQSDAELRSFDFMMRQLSTQSMGPMSNVLIKTPQGLRTLNEKGELVTHDGEFTPNYIMPMLNTSALDKKEVLDVITEWVGTEEEARSLLHHLATSLAPGYSAVKYVLLLGEGRNGKSVLLTMLAELFGPENVSNVSRQMMAERSPTCVELNDKLLNVIFDGEMTYIKDSSMEKTLIAGEPGVVRMLYESGTTRVQTNALFIEALNSEPKARDKSSALQKRLVRFRFPNVYPVDKAFSKKMTSDRYLGAFLSLLIDHYVKEEELADKLAPTAGSIELQIEQVWLGSPVLQFIGSLDPASVDKIETGKMFVEEFMASFKPWAMTQNLAERSDADLLTLLKSITVIDWKTRRINKVPTSRQYIKKLRPEAQLAIDQLKGGAHGPQPTDDKLVGDGDV